MSAAVDWTELPPELLHVISTKLTILTDYVRFRSVCVTWRSTAQSTPSHLPCQLPWLMLPKSRTQQTHQRGFYSLNDNKVHFLDLPVLSSRRRRCGSSYGWLIIVDETPAIFLLNPLTGSRLLLPPLTSFPNVVGFDFYDVGREYSLRTHDGDFYSCSLKEMRDSFIKKLILSSSPIDGSDYICLIILNQTGCKGNRIYYTDDYSEWNYDGVSGDHDLGVYNIEDGSIDTLPCYPRNSYNGRRWPPPIWVTPNPC